MVAERDNVLGSCLVTNLVFVILGEGTRRLSSVLTENGVGAAGQKRQGTHVAAILSTNLQGDVLFCAVQRPRRALRDHLSACRRHELSEQLFPHSTTPFRSPLLPFSPLRQRALTTSCLTCGSSAPSAASKWSSTWRAAPPFTSSPPAHPTLAHLLHRPTPPRLLRPVTVAPRPSARSSGRSASPLASPPSGKPCWPTGSLSGAFSMSFASAHLTCRHRTSCVPGSSGRGCALISRSSFLRDGSLHGIRREANDFANTQTLSQLLLPDILIIAFLSGLGEARRRSPWIPHSGRTRILTLPDPPFAPCAVAERRLVVSGGGRDFTGCFPLTNGRTPGRHRSGCSEGRCCRPWA